MVYSYKENLLLFFILLFIPSIVFSNNGSLNTEVNSKVKKCVACHTITGNSLVAAWPKIAGQHSEYMFKQLIEYKKGKDGNRYDPTMLGMLQGLNENDMMDLSVYFSKQILEKGKVKIDKNKFNIGKKIYLYGEEKNGITACVGCHGFDATGNSLANFPSLKWQHKDYLITQLKKFKTHERSNDVNAIMRDVSINISDDQMDALAVYISCME